MENTTDPARVLSDEESWSLLEARSFGRLAYAIGSHPEIVPINYCANDRKIYFRTAGGDKLFGVTLNHNVAFEIDDIRGDRAKSVIVSGTARRLETSAEIEKAEELPLRPWVPSAKFNYVEIEVDEISGREFHLGPESCD
ncbi:pyridoxamine 5'-phosphate oxidase family protein [Mobilicoccus massiliensis]|uniref:pyridoxamine 5'-phosphate oxidase family protein n=1 Tax=Mobilicoccus massiliensis TaxID=1522310 RepID=UPI00058BC753|nr:pyridoxamine 5'-phosphate oxidase family protein [Mobilicoccus massiliensis]